MLLVLATSVVGSPRTDLLPRWLAAVGFVVAPITFFAKAVTIPPVIASATAGS